MRADQSRLFLRTLRGPAGVRLCLTFPALLTLELLRLAWGEAFTWLGLLGRWGFILIAVLLALAGRVRPVSRARWVWPWVGPATAVLAAAAAAVSWRSNSTQAAWIWLAAWFALLLQLSDIFVEVPSRPLRWAAYLLLAAAAGGLPVAFGQLQGRFSDEEFYVAVQAGAVALFWLLLRLPLRYPAPSNPKTARQKNHLVISPRIVAACLVLLLGMVGALTLHGYQDSFYAPSASLYGPITADSPFLCSTGAPTGEAVSGSAVFHRLMSAVEANPRKGPPEYGMLALGTGEDRWAHAFRESLLAEANVRKFSQAANSVKSTQYDAALRAYYVPRVREAFPNLFTDADMHLIKEWFAAINRRALTVEWVDWMYAAALGRRPLGPYENQENGAGLLAELISSGLEDPALAAQNRAYLDENRRGWLARFRNTDDAFIYQPEWLTNALFQAEYTGLPANGNQSLAFEWLLLQALPNALAPKYNHPGQPSLAGIAYLAALQLSNPEYLWLADKALAAAEANGQAEYAQPGAERSTDLVGTSPAARSCLLYGDSGMPTQVGPLAPDKIVFRDGWAADDPYLLLNLRFSGWHRYKATNAVTLLNIGTPIVSDFLQRATIPWLPTGRSLLRDKRVPREDLSGLLIPEHGVRAVLYALTGIGSPWAQDPPWQADVVTFSTGDELDWSHTRIANWQGWQHDRYIYFYHGGGPVIVADRASGPSSDVARLSWHLSADGEPALSSEVWRLPLRTAGEPVEAVFVPVATGGASRGNIQSALEGEELQRADYAPASAGALQAATLFLRGAWVGSEVAITQTPAGPVVSISGKGGSLQSPLYR